MGTPSYYEGLPIDRAAIAIAVRVDAVAQRFAKRHKYTLGSRLRDITTDVVMLIARCNRRADRARGLRWQPHAAAQKRAAVTSNAWNVNVNNDNTNNNDMTNMIKRRRLAYLFERPLSEQSRTKESP